MLRDHKPDGTTGRPAAILRHDEIAAARLGEPFDALQFRARRRLEARHRCLGACQGGRDYEKGKQEKVLVGKSYGEEPSVWSRRPPRRPRAAYAEIGDKALPMSPLRVRSTSGSRKFGAPRQTGEMGHVWTAPAVQEESDGLAKRSGAAMYPACCRMKDGPSSRCSHCGRWP